MKDQARDIRPTAGRWRALTLLGLLLVGLAVFTSQGWDEAEHTALEPPYQPPPLAAVIPDTEDLSAMYGDVLIPDQAGPPDNRLFLTESPLAADLRAALIGQAWHETWLEPRAGITGVEVTVTEYHVAAGARTQSSTCKAETPIEIPVQDAESTSNAGLIWSNDEGAEGCLFVRIGRQSVSVHTAVLGPDHAVRVEQFLRSYAATHLGWMAVSPDEPTDLSLTSTRTALLRSWLVAILLLTVLAIIPATLFDRATWSRLTSHIHRRRNNPHQTDIDPWSSSILARAHAVSVWRFAGFLWTLRLSEMLRWSDWITAAALAISFVLGALTQRRIMAGALRFHRTRMFIGAPLIIVVMGFVIAAAMVAGAAFVWYLGVSISPLGALGENVPDWSIQRTGLLWQALATLLFVWAIVPISLGRRLGMRLLRGRVPESGGQPVLLLRSFNDDRLRMRARRLDRASIVDQLVMRRWETFEEIEASALGKYGPVLAGATPGERLPPALGAIRLQFTHPEWQARVSQLCEESAFIALNVGRSAGLVWEIRRLVSTGYLHKTIFLIPPVKAKERRLRLALLVEETRTPWSIFDTSGTGRSVLAVCFPLGAEAPLVVVGRGPDDVDYDVAIECCVQALRQADAALDVELQAASALSPVAAGSDQPRAMMHAAIAQMPADNRVAYEPGPAPPVIQVPAGQSKQKRWSVWRLAFWIWMINLFALPILIPLFLTGEPLGERNATTVLVLNDKYYVSSIVSAVADEAIVVLNRQMLVRASFDDEEFASIGSVPEHTQFVGREGDLVFALSPVSGELAAINVTSGAIAWSTTLAPGERGIVVEQGEIITADPGGHQLTVLNLASGVVDRKIPLDCRPWDLTTVLGSVYVTCPDSSAVLALSAGSLAEVARYPVPIGSNTVVPCENTVCAQSNWQHLLFRVDPSSGTGGAILMRTADPLVAATGPIVAVEGYERVSVFDFANDRLIRRLTNGQLTALAISGDGRVLYAQDHRLVRINK